jgi:molecular chaperone DnaK
MAHLGIDLGTSNTLVALVTAGGQPVLEEIDNDRMVPSVVYLEAEGGNPVVGKAALDMWADPGYDPARSFRRWKLAMGTGGELARLELGSGADPLAVTPEFLTTCLVEYVVGQLGGLGGDAIESVLVTVPHGWRREGPEKVRATRRAAEAAQVGGLPLPIQRRTVSEPVAAAAYWLWTAREAGQSTEMEGRTLLVCDLGGGTFDLSLVRVGTADQPLDVVGAVHGDGAGDYADALLCAWVGRQLSGPAGGVAPDTAEGVLEALAAGDPPWLRRWFVRAQQLKHDLSLRAERARGPVEGVKPVRAEFAGQGTAGTVELGVREMEEVLEPFYRRGRELVTSFLSGRGEPPYAVAFAGGGSRIRGVRHRIVEPALRELYGEAEAAAVLGRIRVAEGRLDQAIALGAALIANGVVRVTERLLHDVGIVGCVPPPLAAALRLENPHEPILVSPVLARGTELPSSVGSETLRIVTSADPGERLLVRVVVEDDMHDSWVQAWELPHPGCGRRQSLAWWLEADADGELTVRLATPSGERAELTGTLHRGAAAGSAGLTFGTGKGSSYPRVTPDTFRKALESITPTADD